MSTQKHLIITGISNISWKDATLKAIREVSKTIDYISDITILKQRATIENSNIVQYFVDIDLSFIIDETRKWGIINDWARYKERISRLY